MPLDRFTLTRQSDGHVYTFTARGTRHGKLAYQREDADLWILWHPAWGWMAEAAPDFDGDPTGLPFSMPRSLQNGRPPQGTWVSRKADRSYVYDLRWGAGAC
jgi:hypothetical protein